MKPTRIPKHIKYIVFVYLIGLIFFTLFRTLLFFIDYSQLSVIDNKIGLCLHAFWIGFRFDTVVSGYILSLPLFVLSVLAFFKNDTQVVYKVTTIYIGVLYTFSFLVCAIDIPYFNQFFSRLTVSVLNWLNTPDFMFKMIFQEKSYWIYILPFLFFCWLFWALLFRINKKIRTSDYTLVKVLAFSLLFMALLFIGIRGRLEKKSPIRIGTAYFSSDPFLNQLGLNPVFTFIKSYLNEQKASSKKITLMDNNEAIQYVRRCFNLQDSSYYDSPIARKANETGAAEKWNVVIVIMESMSAEKMQRYGNSQKLTPFLDSISYHAISFNNIYTAGIHTYNGIYSTLFGFPALYNQHPFMQVPIPLYAGIANTLKENGYQTIFFINHDDQFDNNGGFLRANGFEQIVAEKDYPKEKVLSTLGVPDDFMFEFSIDKLNEAYRKKSPFLAVFMTASDHGPYMIPKDVAFKPKTTSIKTQIVEYADWSLKKFIKLSSQQTWFDSTLFVFVADHGASINPVYEMPLSYHHTPLIFYAPSLIKPESIDKIGGQIDVFPSVMGLLNVPYVNNTLGVNLFGESRPFIFFSSDDKVGCLNDQYFLILKTDGEQRLFSYKNKSTRNCIDSLLGLADSMKAYTYSMLQTTQWLITNNKTVFHKKNK